MRFVLDLSINLRHVFSAAICPSSVKGTDNFDTTQRVILMLLLDKCGYVA